MGILEILGIGVGLSMDAFAISICKGLKMKKFRWGQALVICAFFGGFQALMPLIGYFVGGLFEKYITAFDHWIAFFLLVFLGVKMIIESIKEKGGQEDEEPLETKPDIKELFIMAIATSIDALAVGITFALLDLPLGIWWTTAIIGMTTAVICLAGTFVGFKFGEKFKKTAEIVGGAVLILIGLKILLEGLGVLPF